MDISYRTQSWSLPRQLVISDASVYSSPCPIGSGVGGGPSGSSLKGSVGSSVVTIGVPGSPEFRPSDDAGSGKLSPCTQMAREVWGGAGTASGVTAFSFMCQQLPGSPPGAIPTFITYPHFSVALAPIPTMPEDSYRYDPTKARHAPS